MAVSTSFCREALTPDEAGLLLLRVRLPKLVAEQIGVGQGSEAGLSRHDGKLSENPPLPARCKLVDLLAGITLEYLHSEVEI